MDESSAFATRGRLLFRRHGGFVLLGSGRVIEALFNLILIRAYSEFLSVAEVGQLSLLLTVSGFFMQLFLATSGSFFLRQVVEWRNERRLMREIRHFLAYLLLVLPVAAVLAVAGHRLIGSIAFLPLLPMVLIVWGTVFLQGAQQNLLGAINILGQRSWFVGLSNLSVLMGLSGAILAVKYLSATAVTWQGGYLIAYGAVLPLSLLLLWRHRAADGPASPAGPVAGVFSAGALAYMAPLVVVMMCFWVQNFGYRLILGGEAGTTLLGIFTVGFTIGTTPVLLIAKIVNDYLVPIYFRRIAHRDEEAKVAAWNRLALHYLGAGLIAAPVCAAAARFYCRLLVAPAYWDYAWLAWFGAGFQFCAMIYSAYVQLAQGMMNNRVVMAANVVSSAVILAGTFALTRSMPLAGPGIALVAGGVTLPLLTAIRLHRQFRPQLPWLPLLAAAALGASAAAVVLLAGALVPSPTILESVAATLATGILLVGCLAVFVWKYPAEASRTPKGDVIEKPSRRLDNPAVFRYLAQQVRRLAWMDAMGLKDVIRTSWLWNYVLGPVWARWEVDAWLAAGRPAPVPHPVKARNLMALADLYGIDTLVETGTHKGQMILATRRRFKRVYSIEVFPPLAKAAQRRFRDDPTVTIIEGNSAAVLSGLLGAIDEPVLFWLDAHYSGDGTGTAQTESPIMAEIEQIRTLRRPGRDVIVIDDARCFTGAADYPALDPFLDQLRDQFQVAPRIADDAIVVAMPR